MLEEQETTNTSVDEVEGGTAKKTYQSPQMRIYGNIREVTQGPGRRGNFDTPGARGGDHLKSIP
jgi:hypothetical protein